MIERICHEITARAAPSASVDSTVVGDGQRTTVRDRTERYTAREITECEGSGWDAVAAECQRVGCWTGETCAWRIGQDSARCGIRSSIADGDRVGYRVT